MSDPTVHTCSQCGHRFALPPVPTFADRLSGAVPGHVPFDAYVYAVCPSCGRKDWVEGRKFYGLIGPRTFSKYFADYIEYWRHNGYWFFDSPEIIKSLAHEHAIDLRDCRFFYYEVFEEEFNDEEEIWEPFRPDDGFKTSVTVPASKQLEGYDVVTFSVHTSPECSPLSCNNLAESIETNRHCLFPSFEEAKAHIEAHHFDNSEPGPFRIFAVYSVREA